MKENGLEKIHNINFMILNKFKSVCDEYNITYYLAAGTLLGAVREKDFIAWDDDIDIEMPRDSFEVLRGLPDEVWGEDFRLLKYNEVGMDEYFYDFVPRLLYTGEKIPFYGFEQMGDCCDDQYKNYARLDIFVLDNTYPGIRHKLIVGLQSYVYGLALGHRPIMDYSDYTGLSKIAVIIFSNMGKYISLKRTYMLYEKMCILVRKNHGRLYVSNGEPFNLIFHARDKRFYRNTVCMPIRGVMFNVPEGYDGILTLLYGDYMTPPPLDKRIPIHRIVSD